MHRIELLAKSHDRDGFDCGIEPLNLFLKHTARQHAERGISRTYVLVDENAVEPKAIIGYFALNLCQIRSEALSPEQARKLPRNVSGVRLGRLARDNQFKGQGIGNILMVATMEKFIEVFNLAGGVGLFVDAKDQKAKEFYERFGFVSLPSNEFELFLPLKTIQAALAAGSE